MEETEDEQAMELADIQALIDRAVRSDVPLPVFFAALDRLMELARTEAAAALHGESLDAGATEAS